MEDKTQRKDFRGGPAGPKRGNKKAKAEPGKLPDCPTKTEKVVKKENHKWEKKC